MLPLRPAPEPPMPKINWTLVLGIALVLFGVLNLVRGFALTGTANLLIGGGVMMVDIGRLQRQRVLRLSGYIPLVVGLVLMVYLLLL